MNKLKKPAAGWEERERKFKKWYEWTPYKNKGAICPRRVAGLKCERWDTGEDCVCRRSGGGPYDHTAMWKTKEGKLIFTTEPYHLDSHGLLHLFDLILPLGLEIEIMPRSGWYEGYTICVMIYKPDEKES